MTRRARSAVCGKSLAVEREKLFLRGVTYGTFSRTRGKDGFPDPELVHRDFSTMAVHGINAVRTYEVPPRWVLDLAHQAGLRVMVGLPWEQHVAFLDDRSRVRSIEERVRAGVEACADHPAVLCYAVGSEIPAAIVRWYGRRRIERFLERLYRTAKAEDPEALVTYVNYPTSEYLELPFVDFVCFNVFLEAEADFAAYIARLQNVAGDRPLVLGEIGIDSRSRGEHRQAELLEAEVRAAFAAGCAGTFVFAWTDEWSRGGHDVEDWVFGLVDRARRPKPALAAVRRAYAEVPFARGGEWPRASVVVCSRNGERTLADCLDGLAEQAYPDYEAIVVDDGSTDATADVARRPGVRLLQTENRGLARARNAGLEASTGEIVAYVDDDARPDPHWLAHLADTLRRTAHVGVGGPNIPPFDDGPVAGCVANAPGGPVHVLVSDEEAEHIPGCNMAFWKDALERVGGFDPQFRVAGDDVDVCWRLQQEGGTLGFSPGAVVWHRRRSSVPGFLRQQYGYGKAEALLEREWPERYNRGGHLTWVGRVYGNGAALAARWRIYYGTWGTGFFQPAHAAEPGLFASLRLMPESQLLVLGLAGLTSLGALWWPLLFTLPFLVLAAGALAAEAVRAGLRATFPNPPASRLGRLKLRALTTGLTLLQPLARLGGRLRGGLAPWRRRRASSLAFPRSRTHLVWSETWRPPEERLRDLERDLRAVRVPVLRETPYDRWDLEVRGGMLGGARLRAVVEEHGEGKQLARFRSAPTVPRLAPALAAAFLALAVGAALDHAWAAAGVLAGLFLSVVACSVRDCATAEGSLRNALASGTSRSADDLVLDLAPGKTIDRAVA